MMKLKKLNLIPTKFGAFVIYSSTLIITICILYAVGNKFWYLEKIDYGGRSWGGTFYFLFIIILILIILIIISGFIFTHMHDSIRKYKLSKQKPIIIKNKNRVYKLYGG